MNKKFLPLLIIIVLISGIIGFSPVSENDRKQIERFKPYYKTDVDHLVKNLNVGKSRENTYRIFTVSSRDNSDYKNIASKHISLSLNKSEIKLILSESPDNMTLNIPGYEKNFDLILYRDDVVTSDFQLNLIQTNGLKPEKLSNALFYRGIIKDDNESIVSISIFNDQVMGIISDNTGNYVIGKINDNSDLHVIYNDKDLLLNMDFKCGVEGRENLNKNATSLNALKNEIQKDKDNLTFDTLRLFFVADYQMLVDNGLNFEATENFIRGFFNSVATIYQREGIPVKISRIDIYQFPDPYRNMNDSYEILLHFGSVTRDSFNGDLAHLLSTYHNQSLGGIAWVNVLCQSFSPDDNSGRFAFSNIQPQYNIFPLYSWTVMVVTHETGHNIASKHTHACVWPVYFFGDLGSIDTCVITQENQPCYDSNAVARRRDNATIMSYCHLNGSINFALGFGKLPGDTVRLGYSLAACLDSAVNSNQIPVVFNLAQNFPNPFNPSTSILFALPEDGFVTIKIFDVIGREVVVLSDRNFYSLGIHNVLFESSIYNIASGIYLYQIIVNDSENKQTFSQVKKMVLIK